MNISRRFSILTIAIVAMISVASAARPSGDNAPAGNPIRRGAPLGTSTVVPLDSILSHPGNYAGKTVTVTGVVESNCTRKGCWMEIASAKGKKSVRVTFKDYKFFIPLDSKGMNVTAEGNVMVNTLSREDVDHLISDGATFQRNPDGTATEIAFEATGVELRRK